MFRNILIKKHLFMHNTVLYWLKEYPMNPKALTLGELYGEYNLSTQEWMDGVLSSIMRRTCSGNL